MDSSPGQSRDTIERRQATQPDPAAPSGRPRRARGRPCGFPGGGKGLYTFQGSALAQPRDHATARTLLPARHTSALLALGSARTSALAGTDSFPPGLRCEHVNKKPLRPALIEVFDAHQRRHKAKMYILAIQASIHAIVLSEKMGGANVKT